MKILTIILLFTSCAVFGQTQNGATPNLKSGLEGYWKFEETSGNTRDEKGGSDATVQNVTSTTGKVGNAYTFNGSTSIVTTALTTNYPKISISTWTYKTGAGEGNTGRIFDKVEIVHYFSSNKLRYAHIFSTNLGQWETNATISEDEWHHIVITYDYSNTSNNPIFYVDGVSVAITEIDTPSGTANTSSSPYTIGATATEIRNFDGKIDEILVYNRLLSALEAKQHYNSDNGLLYVQVNFKKNKNYENLINYVFGCMYLGWITSTN